MSFLKNIVTSRLKQFNNYENNNTHLITFIGYVDNILRSYYKIINAKIINNEFQSIIIKVRNESNNKIKYKNIITADNIDLLNNNDYLIEIKYDDNNYPFCSLYINKIKVYEQQYLFIVELNIKLLKNSKKQNIKDFIYYSYYYLDKNKKQLIINKNKKTE